MKSLKPIIYRFANRIRKIYWFIFRPKTAGAICLIRRIKDGGEEFLLIRQTYGSGKWTLPGGGIKKGEDPKETVIREVKEEVALDIDNVESLGSFDTHFEYKYDTVFCFTAILRDKNALVTIDNGEIETAEWFNCEALPGVKVFALEKALEMYKAQRSPN